MQQLCGCMQTSYAAAKHGMHAYTVVKVQWVSAAFKWPLSICVQTG